jgi:hypothetical protein
MRRVSIVLPLIGLFLLAPGLRAADDAKAQAKPSDKAFTFPKQIQLTDEQKAKLEDLKKEYGPKLDEIDTRLAPIMTPERQKAAAEARKKATDDGKKGKEVQEAVLAALNLSAEDQAKYTEATKDRAKLMKEVNAKKMDLLTDDQKAQLKPKDKQ